jgi:hypothetical protein
MIPNRGIKGECAPCQRTGETFMKVVAIYRIELLIEDRVENRLRKVSLESRK